MPDPWLLLNLVATALLSFMAVGLATEHATARGWLAQPGPRQSHNLPTPTGGGIGMVVALAIIAFLPGFADSYPDIWRQGVLPGLVLLGVVGWLDDRQPLSPLLRLAVQLGASLWVLVCAGEIWNASGGLLPTWAAGAGIVYMVGLMNVYNFMDGSNGMSGTQGVFGSVLLAALFTHAGSPGLATCALAVAGACAGFLPWNVPQARVFMGDAGSVPLGFVLAALVVLGVAAGILLIPMAFLVFSPFLTDASLTLTKRLVNGERWYTAHNQHAYQRLIQRGWSHNRVLFLYQSINVVMVLPAVVLATIYPKFAWPLTGIVYLILFAAWNNQSLKPGGES